MISSDFYMGGMLDFSDDISILKKNNEYDTVPSPYAQFSYDFSDPRLKELTQVIGLNEIAGTGDDFVKLIKITFEVAGKLNLGAVADTTSFHALEVFEQTRDGLVSNCFVTATVLAECFLSLGYVARMVRCMPIDLRFKDCHCMTIAKVRKYQKFVAFDAAMGGYYVDSCGIPMGICEIQNALIQGKDFKIRSIFKIDQQDIKQYLAKNMVRFQSHKISRYGNEIGDQSTVMINLNPKSLPIANKKYTIRDRTINDIYIYNKDQFWA